MDMNSFVWASRKEILGGARYSISATLPIALADARERGMLEPGMNVVLAAFGAGFTWGAGVLQWGP